MPLGASRIFGGFVNPTISDNFTRANATSLGSTPVGNKLWTNLVGTFSINSNLATPSSTGVFNLAAIDILDSNMEVMGQLSYGGDAVYFRVVDANNWWCARLSSTSTTGPQQVTEDYNSYTDTCSDGSSCSGSGCYTCSGCCASGAYTGVTACYTTGTCYITMNVTTYYTTLTLTKNVAGIITDVASASVPTAGSGYVKVVALKNLYQIYFQNTLELSYTDPSPTLATRCGIGVAPSTDIFSQLTYFFAIPL